MRDNFGNVLRVGDYVTEIGDKRVCVVDELHPTRNAVTISRGLIAAGCLTRNLVKLSDEEAMLYKLENA